MSWRVVPPGNLPSCHMPQHPWACPQPQQQQEQQGAAAAAAGTHVQAARDFVAPLPPLGGAQLLAVAGPQRLAGQVHHQADQRPAGRQAGRSQAMRHRRQEATGKVEEPTSKLEPGQGRAKTKQVQAADKGRPHQMAHEAAATALMRLVGKVALPILHRALLIRGKQWHC